MLVDCPECSRSYHLAPDEIGPEGRVVICPRCRTRWFQQSETLKDRLASNNLSWLSATRPTDDRSPGRTKSRSLRFAPALGIAVLATAAVACTQARESIVRLAPRTAALYSAVGWPVNVRGLEFTRLTPELSASVDATIAGEFRNVAHRSVPVPRISFEVRDGKGQALVLWSENAKARMLDHGKTLAFASTPRRLPPESRTVLVRFQDEAPLAPGAAGGAP